MKRTLRLRSCSTQKSTNLTTLETGIEPSASCGVRCFATNAVQVRTESLSSTCAFPDGRTLHPTSWTLHGEMLPSPRIPSRAPRSTRVCALTEHACNAGSDGPPTAVENSASPLNSVRGTCFFVTPPYSGDLLPLLQENAQKELSIVDHLWKEAPKDYIPLLPLIGFNKSSWAKDQIQEKLCCAHEGSHHEFIIRD